MVLTEAEYTSLRSAYLTLLTGAETARVTVLGKTIEYFQRDMADVKNMIDGYELANGTGAVRTYARNIRRR